MYNLDKNLDIPGWMNVEELRCLNRMASQMNSVVEIGSWKGRSSYALLSGCNDVVCVDHWKGSDHPILLDEAKERNVMEDFLANTDEFKHNRTVMQMSSEEACAYFGEKSVDMVFIDGGHDYDTIKKDLELWTPKARKLICGHDAEWPGVAQAVYEKFGKVAVTETIWWVVIDGGQPPKDKLVDLRKMRKKIVSVCLPGSNFSGAWLRHWNELFAHLMKTCYVYLNYAEGNNIYQVRNLISKCALNFPTKPDYILWIDSDNLVSAKGFEHLKAAIEFDEDGERVDACGAWYRIPNGKGGSFIAAGPIDRSKSHLIEQEVIDSKTLVEVGFMGFGFLLMKREVLEAMGEQAFIPTFNGEWCTDDGGFCDRAVQQGFKLYVNPLVFSPHLKLNTVPA